MKYIDILLHSAKTCFKSKELSMMWGVQNNNTLKNILQRMRKENILSYEGFGLWCLPNYNIFEFASKIKSKSYISLETVLQLEGVVFQDYSHTFTLISDNTIQKSINGFSFDFHKVSNTILTNFIGIVNTGKYMIATKERAICDRIYLTPNYFFDNIPSYLNLDLMDDLSEMYNKSTNFIIKKLIHELRSKSS